MSVTITQKTRRRLALAVGNRDEAEAYCDSLELSGGVANTDVTELEFLLPDFAAAGDDLANFPLMSLDVGVTLSAVTLVAYGDYVGIDASNTMVVAVKDQAGNTIVTKTFNDSTVPTDSGADDLGTLDGTHKVLNADELCKVSVTNGATALPPSLGIRLAFHQ